MIVVDLGCKSHGEERSIEPLIERFKPQILYGFDPHPQLSEGITSEGFTTVVCARLAASTSSTRLPYLQDGSSSRIDAAGDTTVQAFDLAAWLNTLPHVPIVLKMDVEGAERWLLPLLALSGADRRLDLLLVEWHGQPIDYELACKVEPWP